ncbi:hypothetical protein ZWY2020_054398 [Hordeum vulgare]|nr:hypothetical protein ZWY2020_054398 [Hordeum vulgare]
MESESSSSSSADPHPSAQPYAVIDMAIKCLNQGACRDKIEALAAACAGQEPPPDADADEARASAREALVKCIMDVVAAAARETAEQEGKSS